MDNTSFERFEIDFNKRIDEFNKLTGNIKILEKRTVVIQQCDTELYDMDKTLKKFEVELRNLPFNLKSKYQPTIKNFRTWYDNKKLDVAHIKSTRVISAPAIDDVRNRLLESDSMLVDMEASLINSRRAIEESESLGGDITRNLIGQRRQLEQSRDLLEETDSYSDKATKTISTMSRRLLTDKLIQGVVVCVEIGIIGLIIYFRYYK